MVKKIIAIFISCFILVGVIVIYFWRDTQFQPQSNDLIRYFVLLPLLITTALISPWLIYQAYQKYKDKKQQVVANAQNQNVDATEPTQVQKSTWLQLNIYASGAYSALGENDSTLEGIQMLAGPLLDNKLSGSHGLPVLSYRIEALDQLLSEDTTDEDMQFITTRQQRIMLLIQHQIQQHNELLNAISAHLQHSSLFYESQNLHEYRMHPAWIDPTVSSDEETELKQIEPVYRLDKLNVHIILSEDVIHTWNDQSSHQSIQAIFYELGIIPQKFYIEYHFISRSSVDQYLIELFDRIQKQSHEIALIIAADSELDQDILDEKIWGKNAYTPAEFVSSWCVTSPVVEIEQLQPLKTLKLVSNQNNLKQIFDELDIHDLPQYEDEVPFVLVVEDGADIKVVKKLEQFFAQSPVEPHHYLYCQPMAGHTQNVAKVFGLMLGAQLPDPQVAFVYSQDLKAFIQTFSEINQDQERVAIAD
ncbi:hypothetical protein EXE30_02415 [Acinetobacter halotolerans]|uniref:Uncharacterized protein n=1 Tax=Acinetobacter halotolerans TaxID=1752076 RepID=A0A4Q6XBJ1_9GAMM|nr:hypothetical protein [Acinetobacter halotolerans]RZF55681.1 hypothetical protein EXE30_02415 [Acinetobacter halotolerans]